MRYLTSLAGLAPASPGIVSCVESGGVMWCGVVWCGVVGPGDLPQLVRSGSIRRERGQNCEESQGCSAGNVAATTPHNTQPR